MHLCVIFCSVKQKKNSCCQTTEVICKRDTGSIYVLRVLTLFSAVKGCYLNKFFILSVTISDQSKLKIRLWSFKIIILKAYNSTSVVYYLSMILIKFPSKHLPPPVEQQKKKFTKRTKSKQHELKLMCTQVLDKD